MITLTKQEAQQVLDALEVEHSAIYGTSQTAKAIEIFRAKLSEPEIQLGITYEEANQPEPVAWISIGSARMIHWTSDKPAYGDDWEPLYTTPPQREWVGLTDDAIEYIIDAYWGDPPMFIEAIEAKLKEKNAI